MTREDNPSAQCRRFLRISVSLPDADLYLTVRDVGPTDAMPLLALSEMTHGQEGDLFVLMTAKEELRTRDGKPYFKVAFRDAGGALTLPATFTYADVLSGAIVIDVEFGTGDCVVPMTVTDTTGM